MRISGGLRVRRSAVVLAVFTVVAGVLACGGRDEAATTDTRSGLQHALARTGGVITSAGIVLAATFFALALLPLVVLVEVGFTVAFGILLDTFLVRSILVPAIVLALGKRVWWPSTAT